MRIIAGQAKGIRLTSPPDRAIRPTLDRVREALFSIIGLAIDGARFLDLYAGAGAIGLEALSRGAAHVDFLEADRDAARLIRENIQRTRLSQGARVYIVDLPQGLERFPAREPYAFIYADPPHAFADYEALFQTIDRAGLLAADGTLILEHGTRTPVPDDVGTYHRLRSARYGETTLSFFSQPDKSD